MSPPARCLAGLALVAVLSAGAARAASDVGRVLHRFAAPGDYPEGLAWDGAHLWVNNFTDGALYKIDPADGRVLGRSTGAGLPPQPEGLAFDGTHLWTCDWQSGVISKLRQTAQGVAVVAAYDKPAEAGRTVGLEWDGRSLWLACFGVHAGDKSQLFELDPDSLGTRRIVDLPVYWVEDLAWDGRWLWSVDWLFRIGFAIDPATGDTLHTYRTPGPNPVGMAWDGEKLWLSDTTADSIWALDISGAHGTPVRPATWSDVKRVFR